MARIPDITKAIEATVAKAVRTEVAGEIRKLERQVGRLTDKLKTLSRVAGRRGVAGNGAASDRPVSKGRQLHGRYIGLLRHLPKKQQARVRSIRKQRGVHAAIKAAEQVRRA